ncbi:hypothetical protein [Bartonella ancashensis]|uniref:Uncharacterized protein n=1 Tax=Bartonella ancashensis TaxID=1318743 RepID=A0A0M3T2H8_9HYPH|nr:hypothetical protein [Bartonella ancashensis]ALE02871.1 hypothetical protein PU02_0057 [Bartonella ancashensis]
MLEKQAKRLGVSFDAEKAIQNGISLEKAKQIVLDTAISKSASLQISPYVSQREGNNKATVHAKWAAAWKSIIGK